MSGRRLPAPPDPHVPRRSPAPTSHERTARQMRLATARIHQTTRLIVESPSGAFVDVASADPALAYLSDVGDVLRAGQTALELIAAAARQAGAEHAVDIESVELAAPVERPGKLICVGLNYRRHAEESDTPIPER